MKNNLKYCLSFKIIYIEISDKRTPVRISKPNIFCTNLYFNIEMSLITCWPSYNSIFCMQQLHMHHDLSLN